MKIITIRLTVVEEAMLIELKKKEKELRDLSAFIKGLIHERYKRINP
jgi:hypothetical protein